jgi:hypothetical protein
MAELALLSGYAGAGLLSAGSAVAAEGKAEVVAEVGWDGPSPVLSMADELAA